MEISTTEWVGYHLVGVLFWLWILNWGGAKFFEGVKSALFLHWFSGDWKAEQIRLYALGMLIAQIIWFAAGLVTPEYRWFW